MTINININLQKLTEEELENLRHRLINVYNSITESDSVSKSIKEEIEQALWNIYEESQLRMYDYL